VFSPYLYRCCSCSLCLLSVKLPLSRPTSFCLFPFSSAPQSGGGAAAWSFCCWPQQNYNMHSANFQQKQATKQITLCEGGMLATETSKFGSLKDFLYCASLRKQLINHILLKLLSCF